MITYTVTGEGPILAKLNRRMNPALGDTLRKAKTAALTAMRPFLTAESPFKTGATRSSVTVRGSSVGPRIWYRHFVIGGTKRGVRANPWVARGARRGRVATTSAFKASVKRDIK